MPAAGSGAAYKIWGKDDVVYGPIELPNLIECVRDDRVLPTTWIYSEAQDAWLKAAFLPELRLLFEAKLAAASGAAPGPAAHAERPPPVKPAALRRVRILATLTDAQLLRFVQYLEVLAVKQWTQIVKLGDHGDAMYLVLEGELRVRFMIGSRETTLVTLNTGEFFGEISLFDHGPRSADVIANQDSLLLRISAAAFEQMLNQAPDLAAPFLYAMSKTLAARIRADNKRYRDSIQFARAAAR